ncbi:DUF4340 domain-containing protein [Oleiharenicola lentus]|uniref:DUF4340 domain-containing protein n=1 Tax=Oleiharenicola lentus TaxID=2508720 RepID=UPI003F66D933
MRSKVTIILLFLNVVLFFYIFKFEEVTLPDAGGRRVFGPEIAGATAFTRTTANAPTVRFALDATRGNTWWLTQPYDWPANQNAVASIINELKFLEHDISYAVADFLKTGQTLAEIGLAEPTTTISFEAAGKNYTVKLGKETEVGNRLYVLSPDETRIHVVKRNFADIVRKPLEELRATSIFTVPVFEVRSLNIQTAAPANLKVRLRRDASNRWGFESPVLARASKAATEVTVNNLNSLNTRRFLEARETDLERDGLNSPALRVTLEGNARRETLLIGNVVPPAPNAKPVAADSPSPEKEYFAKIEDKSVVFTASIPDRLIEILRTSQESLRDPHVMEFDPAEVSALTLTAPGQPELVLQRLESPDGSLAWQAVSRLSGQAPATIPADTAVINELVQRLLQLSARRDNDGIRFRFLNDAPSDSDIENYGFKRPEREITLGLEKGGGTSGNAPSTQVLQIGTSPDQPGRAFARNEPAPFIYEIVPDILDQTPVNALHYKQRLLRELPDGARITALRITELPGNASVLDVANPTALTPETLATLTLSDNARKAITTLLAQLRTFKAKRFIADTFSDQQVETAQGSRPWKYKLEIDLTLPGSNAPAQPSVSTLYFTERLGGTTTLAGTSEFGGVVFELTQEMVDALFALTYGEKNDPGAPKLPASKDEPAPAPKS